jgi:hypothetical protein
MKNQYVGDIRDFEKYAVRLLQQLVPAAPSGDGSCNSFALHSAGVALLVLPLRSRANSKSPCTRSAIAGSPMLTHTDSD